MKITRCKYGHYYDKAYFRECPHCCRARGGRDEDIIIENANSSISLEGRNGEINQIDNEYSAKKQQINNESFAKNQKEDDREKVKRWIGEAWDELEEILGEETLENQYEDGWEDGYEEKRGEKGVSDTKGEVKEKSKVENRKKEELSTRRAESHKLNEKRIVGREGTGRATRDAVNRKGITEEPNKDKKEKKNLNEKDIEENLNTKRAIKEKSEVNIVKNKDKVPHKNAEDFMLLSAMPLKVIKNQEFCMDFCLFPEKEWETGAKMLAFKSQESIRDLKPVRMHLPAKATLHILYKDEEILSKEIEIDVDRKSTFCTFPVTVTDTRDRRFHMIKVVFEVSEQGIKVPLYLMPNPYKKCFTTE